MTPEMLDSIIADLCNSPDLKFSQRYALQSLRKDRNDLQSQLAAANEQIRRLWPAKLSAAPCSICGYNGPGYYQAETHPCAAQKADAAAPVPSQPAGTVMPPVRQTSSRVISDE